MSKLGDVARYLGTQAAWRILGKARMVEEYRHKQALKVVDDLLCIEPVLRAQDYDPADFPELEALFRLARHVKFEMED